MNTARIAFSPDNKWLAAAEFKAQGYMLGRVKLIDLSKGVVHRTMTYDGGNVRSQLFVERRQEGVCDLAFSPDGRWLAAGMRSGRVFLWGVDGVQDHALTWAAHTSSLTRVQFGIDSRMLWTSSGGDKAVKRWRFDGAMAYRPAR